MIIDITNELYTQIKNTLTDVEVLKSYPQIDASFPCVIFREILNITKSDTIDSSGENHNVEAYGIEIYTNSDNKITQAKSIRNSVDEIMAGTYGMNRSECGEVPNYSDMNIYRYVMRYDCVVDKNKTIYRG